MSGPARCIFSRRPRSKRWTWATAPSPALRFVMGSCPPWRAFTPRQDGRPHFMVLHGDPNGPAYRTASPADIAASGLCYLALGHIHRRAACRTETGVTYAWPGCFLGRGFDETGPKGVYLVQAAPHQVQLHFQMLDAPRYEILDVPAARLADLASQLPKDSTRHHYRIRLTGRRPGDGPCRAAGAARAPFCLPAAGRRDTAAAAPRRCRGGLSAGPLYQEDAQRHPDRAGRRTAADPGAGTGIRAEGPGRP